MGVVRLCVLCRRHPVDDRWTPFCSERCRTQDLARWADGGYRIAAEPVASPDDDDEIPPPMQ
ncbi:MAG: DNA gyrase inhibitor YacG [Vicinamibacterales bacterium]